MYTIVMERLKKMFKTHKRETLRKKTVKILVMGMSGVGKTRVIQKLCNLEEFSQNYVPTCYEVYQRDVVIDDCNVTMQFMDFGGKHEFPSMQDVFIRQADIFLLVYSFDNLKSFDQIIVLREFISKVKKKHSTEIPIIVIRNKTDLRKKSKNVQMRKIAIQQWCYLTHDVSAKTGVRINAVMDSLIEESKFIGNYDDLTMMHSGRFVYDSKKDILHKKEQYHKSPTMFKNVTTSDEQMRLLRTKSLNLKTRTSSFRWKKTSLQLKAFRNRMNVNNELDNCSTANSVSTLTDTCDTGATSSINSSPEQIRRNTFDTINFKKIASRKYATSIRPEVLRRNTLDTSTLNTLSYKRSTGKKRKVFAA